MKQIPDEVLDQPLEDCDKPEDILGANGLLASLQKSILERILEAKLTDHLGYCKHQAAGRGSGNSRNGHGSEPVLTGKGSVRLEVPRDRNGNFEPQFVAQRQTRLPGFDEEVISLYARGLTLRDIRAHLQQRYRVSVSPDLISRVTDAVNEEVKQWQQLPLDPLYPVLFFNALRVRIRDEGSVRNKAAYLALGIRMDPHQAGAGAVDRAERGCALLAEGDERAQGARHAGLPDRRGGRPQGLPASHSQRVPRGRSPDLHRASDAARAQTVLLPRAPRDGPPYEGDLPGRQRRGRRRPPG